MISDPDEMPVVRTARVAYMHESTPSLLTPPASANHPGTLDKAGREDLLAEITRLRQHYAYQQNQITALMQQNDHSNELVAQYTRRILQLEREIVKSRDDFRRLHRFLDSERQLIMETLKKFPTSPKVEQMKLDVITAAENKLSVALQRSFAGLVNRYPEYFTRQPQNQSEMFDELVSAIEVFAEDSNLADQKYESELHKNEQLRQLLKCYDPDIDLSKFE